jgi:hypothetical protein
LGENWGEIRFLSVTVCGDESLGKRGGYEGKSHLFLFVEMSFIFFAGTCIMRNVNGRE